MVECKLIKQNNLIKSTESFNRYMVECKYDHVLSAWISDRVLIDTWWNVNES